VLENPDDIDYGFITSYLLLSCDIKCKFLAREYSNQLQPPTHPPGHPKYTLQRNAERVIAAPEFLRIATSSP
jgi:hypothetical protein